MTKKLEIVKLAIEAGYKTKQKAEVMAFFGVAPIYYIVKDTIDFVNTYIIDFSKL